MTKLVSFLAKAFSVNRKTFEDLWLNLRVVSILILSVLLLIALAWALMGFPTELMPIESY